jgi:TM2 domain-containing membrane protein YozV
VTEFSVIEQQMMTKGLSPEQAMLFNSQFSSAKKDRDTVLILSVILGYWGVDRFYISDMGMGLLKLFTFGGCGILWLIDIFVIRGRADEYNRNKAEEILAGIRMMAAPASS